MKKIFLTAIYLFICVLCYGQIISTKSNTGLKSSQIVSSQHTREGGEKFWFLKLGVNYSGLQNGNDYSEYDIDRSLGYNLETGINKQIARSPFYYSFAFGVCSNLGSSYTNAKTSVKQQLKSIDDGNQQHNIYISPINIGLRLDFGISLDVSGGMFYTFEYLPDRYSDYGFNANAGLWFARFYIGVQAQRGLVDRSDSNDEFYLSNVMLRLGWEF